MKKSIWLISLTAVILLAACQPTATQTPGVTLEEEPTITATLKESSTEEEPTATSSIEVTAESSEPVEVSLGCTVETRRGEPTPESLFRAVEDIDHVLGSDTAKVTFIEYSDFQ
jgi:hypothetical protein